MGKIYKQNCKQCGKYYEGRGMYFCSTQCSGKNEDRIRKQSEKIRGKPSWNKGLHHRLNNALELWHKNGGVVWNKNLKGIHLSPYSEFKKDDTRVKGKNNSKWKGGITSKHIKIRHSLRYKQWRRGIQDFEYLTQAYAINSSAVDALVDEIIPEALYENDGYGIYGDKIFDRWSSDPDVWRDAREQLADIILGN